jgi:hypothetical protein
MPENNPAIYRLLFEYSGGAKVGRATPVRAVSIATVAARTE